MGEQRIKIKWSRVGPCEYRGYAEGIPAYTIEGEGSAGQRRWRAFRHTVDGDLRPARTGGALESLLRAKAQAEHDLVEAGGVEYVAGLALRLERIAEFKRRGGEMTTPGKVSMEEVTAMLDRIVLQQAQCHAARGEHYGWTARYLDTAGREMILCTYHATAIRADGGALVAVPHPAAPEAVEAIEREIDERLARIRQAFRQLRDERDAWRRRALEAEGRLA